MREQLKTRYGVSPQDTLSDIKKVMENIDCMET